MVSNVIKCDMKKLMFIFLLFTFLFTQGKEINIDKAKQVAINYLKTHSSTQLKSAKQITLTQVNNLFFDKNTTDLKSTTIDSSGLFIFNIDENQGFIVISGNDATIPVLAYGEEGKLEAGKVPDGLMFFLNSYVEQLRYLNKNPIDQSYETKEIWDNLINETSLKSSNSSFVKPLLNPPLQPENRIMWGQSGFFNDGFKLIDIENNKRAITGCIATAMAQVLKYNNWPKQGFGFHTYFHEQIGEISGDLSAIFGKTIYDWNEMPGVYDSNSTSNNIKAVSNLMLHCGRSVNMKYTLDKDGNALSLAALTNTIVALIDHFGYSESMHLVKKQDYSELEWEQIIQSELDNKRLVIYGGFQLAGNGHAFICDGYEITNGIALYNFNWGWAGDGNDAFGNSYCAISALVPSNTPYNFSTGQQAIIDIKPKTFSYYDLKLDKFSFNDFIHGSSVNISTEITNNGNNNFIGNICLAIFNKDDKFLVKIQELNNITIKSGETKQLTFDYSKVNLLANNYTLGVFYKVDGFNEVAINNGISNNFSNVIVKQYFQQDLVLNEPFSLSKNPIIQNTSFSVTANISNLGLLPFSGTIGLGIFGPNGLIKQIDEKSIENLTATYSPWKVTFQSGGLDNLPGNYLFGIYQKTHQNEIIILNPIENSTEYLNVISPPVPQDVYEMNDIPIEAFHLNYPENSNSLPVYGATIHNYYDIDFYKLNLPEGFIYKIKANVYDVNNPLSNSNLTCDVFLKYFVDSNWTYEFDSFGEEVTTTNGGEILFLTAPKNEGLTGSYILEIIIQREVKILGIEYFWDNLNSNKSFIPFSGTSDQLFDIHIPLNNISPGLHRLYFRTKDSDGNWSLVHSKPVLVEPDNENMQIERLEYFVDEMIGEGEGTSLSINKSNNVIATQNINLENLSEGLHRIHFRAQNSSGSWSLTHSRPFLIKGENLTSDITDIEYFFDEKTTPDKKYNLVFTESNAVNISQNIDIKEIDSGLHRLYFRAKNSKGNWSTTHSRPLLVSPSFQDLAEINRVEYYFDNDPGYNKGESLTFTQSSNVELNKNIPLKNLQTGQHSIVFRARDNFGNWSFPQWNTFLIENNCDFLSFKNGWNIFSIPFIPDSVDLKHIFNPFINSNSLLKIQDEKGNSMEDWGIYGSWQNFIGDVSATEGYKVKVNKDDSLEICGTPVEYPFAIPLKSGWNIMGYPQNASYDGLEVIKQLIDRGKLIKAQDEAGNSIEDWGIFGGWKNNIGDFIPGKGYNIKLNSDDTFWINESYPKSSAFQPEVAATVHFKTAFEGNGLDHMNINLVGLPVDILQAGDELAVFDGNICVVAVKLMSHHLINQLVQIAASVHDYEGLQGFNEGNRIKLKLWRKQQNEEFELDPEIVMGSPTFTKNESTFINLEKYNSTGFDVIKNQNHPEINCYPNPFNNEINIEIRLAKDSEVQIDVLNQLGQTIQKIKSWQILNQGLHEFKWNGRNENNTIVTPGIYYLKVQEGKSVLYKKLMFSK